MKTVFVSLAVLVCACSGSGMHPAGGSSGTGGSSGKHLHIPTQKDGDIATLEQFGGHAGQTGVGQLADGGQDDFADAATVSDAEVADGGTAGETDAASGSGGSEASGSGGAGAAGMGGSAGMGGFTGALVACSLQDVKSNGTPMWPTAGKPYCTKLDPRPSYPDHPEGNYTTYQAACCADGFVGCDEGGSGTPPAGSPGFNCVHECGLNDPSCS